MKPHAFLALARTATSHHLAHVKRGTRTPEVVHVVRVERHRRGTSARGVDRSRAGQSDDIDEGKSSVVVNARTKILVLAILYLEHVVLKQRSHESVDSIGRWGARATPRVQAVAHGLGLRPHACSR